MTVSETDVDLLYAMEQLSQNQRNVITLKFMYILPNKEIIKIEYINGI